MQSQEGELQGKSERKRGEGLDLDKLLMRSLQLLIVVSFQGSCIPRWDKVSARATSCSGSSKCHNEVTYSHK